MPRARHTELVEDKSLASSFDTSDTRDFFVSRDMLATDILANVRRMLQESYEKNCSHGISAVLRSVLVCIAVSDDDL